MLYISPYILLPPEHDVEHHHLYADDTQTYISLSGFEAFGFLTESKLYDTYVFTLTYSKLKLNSSKNELVIIGSEKKKFKDLLPILLFDHDTLPKTFVRKLGSIFDCDFNFKRQISQTGKIYACLHPSVTFGVLGSTLAQKMQNLLHVL